MDNLSTIYTVNGHYKKLMLDKRTFKNTNDMLIYLKLVIERPLDDIVNLLGEILENVHDDKTHQELFNKSAQLYSGLNGIKDLIARKNLGK